MKTIVFYFSVNQKDTGELEVVSKNEKLPEGTLASGIAKDGFAGDKSSVTVQETIANLNKDSSDKEIIFNKNTGELEVVSKNEKLPEGTLASGIAKDGFAVVNPIVYLYEEEITDFIKETKTFQKGVAFEWKGEEVYHIHTKTPKLPVSGVPCMSFLIKLSSVKEFEFPYQELIQKFPIGQYFESSDFGTKAIICFFVINNKGTILKKSVSYTKSSCEECDTFYVPQKSELYSRAKGLLEVDALEKKKVAIIGLGSFGSQIAVELAKAGVGCFKLFDFDRIELSNVSRHICGVNDLGRYKTYAIRDAILLKNPYANIKTFEININEQPNLFVSEVEDCDLLLCLTDENQSRVFINDFAIHKKKVIYARAITRAEAGDVFRYTPEPNKPCLACLIGNGLFKYSNEEISSKKQLFRDLPAYTRIEDKETDIQVGLSADISPICNLVVKLALVELSKGIHTGISSLEEDLEADYYLWVNRRYDKYRNWEPMKYKANQLTILRWYGVRISQDEECITCKTHSL